jgi:ABC-type antimicrobial peptide transport system permease subunit
MALGASRLEVVRNVMGRTLILTAMGIVAGGIASIWAGRVVGSLLFGVGAVDPATYLGMAGVLLAVAVLAGLVPALRAGRIRGTRALKAI